MEEVPLRSEDVELEGLGGAQDPVVDPVGAGQTRVDAPPLPLDVVEAEVDLGFLGQDVPDAERGPDVDLLVGGGVAGLAFLPEVLSGGAEVLVAVTGEGAEGRPVLAVRPLP